MSNTVGRPRLRQSQRPNMDAVEEILDASAELFTTKGYASTSTRSIAESVGLRQASIYHHFPTKQAILTSLLLTTVETPLAVADRLAGAGERSAVRLHALVQFDTAQLFASRWNLGALYLLPEIRGAEFTQFLQARDSLRAGYARLTDETAGAEGLSLSPFLREVPFRLVETAINMRMDDAPIADTLPSEFADTALRAIGVPELSDADRDAAAALATQGA